MNRRGVGCVAGPGEEVWTGQDVVNGLWVFCLVEGAWLIGNR